MGKSLKRNEQGVPRRKSSRWECDAEFLPIGASLLPSQIEDKVYFRVTEISKNGLTLLTSLRNQESITKGMSLDLRLNIPTVTNKNLKIVIVHKRVLNVGGRDQLCVGAEITNADRNLHNSIAQYLIQFSPDVTLQALKKEKLLPVSIAEAVKFTTVRTEQEYEEVLQVRLKAYNSAKKISSSNASIMKSKYDRWDRIIVGKHQGKIVSSCLLIFPQEGELLEIEEDMNLRLDDFIDDRTTICEFTRLSSLPDYRGNDLLLGMFREVAKTCLAEGRIITFGSADERMSKVYEGIGYRKTGIEFQMERYKGINHYAMVGNIRESVLAGKKVKIQYWPFLWKPLAKYINNNHKDQMTLFHRIHLKVYRLITPILEKIKP